MDRINVTKTYLPPREEYDKYVDTIWEIGQVTNQGPLLRKLESELEQYLSVDNLHLVTNGTIAIQLAFRALGVTEGEVITTPFSYVASTSAVLWEHLTPIFVDINPETFCIDPSKIEAAITSQTKAILAVHVFGYPCDVEAIEAVAQKYDLKVIYDAAHVFGATYKGRSLLDYGDASTCSFHATKVFHTIEGGCVVIRDKNASERLELIKRFGHHGDEHFMLGINGKTTEFNAAMGLSVLPHFQEIVTSRRLVSEQYDLLLGDKFQRPKKVTGHEYNYYAYPVVFDSEERLIEVVDKLQASNIFPRRYFYPSLNTLPYLDTRQSCPVSESVASRILCLPLYVDLAPVDVERICEIVSS